MEFESIVTGAASGELLKSPLFGMVALAFVVIIVAFWFNRRRKENVSSQGI